MYLAGNAEAPPLDIGSAAGMSTSVPPGTASFQADFRFSTSAIASVIDLVYLLLSILARSIPFSMFAQAVLVLSKTVIDSISSFFSIVAKSILL